MKKETMRSFLLAKGWTHWHPKRNHHFMAEHDRSFVCDPLCPSTGHQIKAAYTLQVEREKPQQLAFNF